MDVLARTKFGVPYKGKPLKFSGTYKYTPGAIYRIDKETVNKKDEFAMYALLDEATDEEGKEVTLIGGNSKPKNQKYRIDAPPYVVMRVDVKYEGAKTDWITFNVEFKNMNDKVYDAKKTYKLTIVCASSKDGADYNGGIGSTLHIDKLAVYK